MPRRAAVRHVVRDANLGRAIERDTCIFRHSRDAVKRGSTGDGLSCGNTWATMQRLLAFRAVAFGKCRIPSDHIPIRSWPLFLARELMRDLIETLKAEQST